MWDDYEFNFTEGMCGQCVGCVFEKILMNWDSGIGLYRQKCKFYDCFCDKIGKGCQARILKNEKY